MLLPTQPWPVCIPVMRPLLGCPQERQCPPPPAYLAAMVALDPGVSLGKKENPDGFLCQTSWCPLRHNVTFCLPMTPLVSGGPLDPAIPGATALCPPRSQDTVLMAEGCCEESACWRLGTSSLGSTEESSPGPSRLSASTFTEWQPPSVFHALWSPGLLTSK